MKAYDFCMGQSAAVMVLDHHPTDEEIDELADAHVEECEDQFITEIAAAVVYEAPDFMSCSEQDQINAHLRDGGACVLVLYVTYSDEPDDDF